MARNLHVSDTGANAEANAIAPLLNGGFLKIYDGIQPTNANTAIGTQNLLATLTFAATAFGAASGGVITAAAIGSATAAATSTATWFRCFKSDGTTVVLDGSVGASGCDLNLNSTSIVSGQSVSVSSFTITIQE